MRILLIDNSTKNLEKLKKLLLPDNIKVIKATDITKTLVNESDAIILSGSSKRSLLTDMSYFTKEIELIKTSQKKILGICFGFELICFTHGTKLVRMKKKIGGIKNVYMIKHDKIFNHIQKKNFKIYESHHWIAEKLPRELIGLAKTKYYYEIVKVKGKPIYGLQFHPEKYLHDTSGDTILRNILAL